jgi:hypothetical protein
MPARSMPEPENPALGPVPTLEQLLIEPGRVGGLPLDAVAAFLTQCAALQAALAARIVTALAGEPPDQKGALLVDTKPPSEYLSIRELAARIPYTEGSIRNLMTQGELRLGEHYVKPKGRIVFKWNAVRDWFENQPAG